MSLSQPYTFTPGDYQAEVDIRIIDDSNPEERENFTAMISEVSMAIEITDPSVTVTIEDDDSKNFLER